MTNIHIYFLNMDISLIMTVTCLKNSTHDANTHMEGSRSQNVDLGFSFRFIDFAKKKEQKITNVTRFYT